MIQLLMWYMYLRLSTSGSLYETTVSMDLMVNTNTDEQSRTILQGSESRSGYRGSAINAVTTIS